MAAVPVIVPHAQDSALLSERQTRRRFEKVIVERGFEGNITVTPDPGEATKLAHLEHLSTSHWGEKDSRMVFWASSYTITARLDTTSGIGIVSRNSPDPDQWVWGAYRVIGQVDAQMADILAVGMALRIAKDECDRLVGMEMPSKVVVYSSARDALMRIQESNFVAFSGG